MEQTGSTAPAFTAAFALAGAAVLVIAAGLFGVMIKRGEAGADKEAGK